MRAAAMDGDWEVVAVEDLGGSPFLVGDRVVWYVPTGSPEGDRKMIARALRTYHTTEIHPENP